VSAVRLLGGLDRSFAWDGSRLYEDADFRPTSKVPTLLRGAAAFVQPVAGAVNGWRILRDPLGINKLFWVRDEDGSVAIAARPQRLTSHGYAFEGIYAIPRGAVLELSPAPPDPANHSILPQTWFSQDGPETLDVETAGHRIRSTLERYIDAIATAYPSAPMFVCLSGGLDSSGIAALARQHVAHLVAVSFDLRRPGRRPSEDRATAERLARDLRLPLLKATVTEDQLFEHMDTVLVEGIDWRDFNVHAALVNAALAAAIDEAAKDHDRRAPVIVLTGDLANEFLVDYHPESYKGRTYYELPRLPATALRASLVQGLDTSNREVGVFAAWSLSVVQPYAVAVDTYLALPGEFLRLEDRKERLCRATFGTLIPEYVYVRPKVRAQVGGAQDGGVLATCVDRGLDAAWLQHRFAGLHGLSNPGPLDRFLRAGRYRTAIPSLVGEPGEH
jgi:asparagine synthetase B (glutamine-hydrolysing)